MTDEYKITKSDGTTVTVAEEDANGNIAGLFDLVNTDELNSAEWVQAKDDPQTRINDAGVNATVYWEETTHTLSTPIKPKSGQTWIAANGVQFEPTGDNRVLDLVGVSDVSFIGRVRCDDPNNNTTSAYAVLIDGLAGSYIQNLMVNGFWNGINNLSSNGDVKENRFDKIRVINSRNYGIVHDGTYLDNHHGSVFIKSDSNKSPSHGLRYIAGTTSGGNTYGTLFIGGHTGGVGLRIENLLEVWINTLIVDNCDFGMRVTGPCERLFVNQLYTASNGNQGTLIDPGSTETLEDIHFGKLYTWNNSGHGFRTASGTIDGLYVGALYSQNNNTANVGHNNVTLGNTLKRSVIGHLRSYGGAGVDASGGTLTNVHILREVVEDSITHSEFTSVNGVLQPEDLSIRNGDYVGEIAHHNGNSQIPETKCRWDGSNWRVLESVQFSYSGDGTTGRTIAGDFVFEQVAVEEGGGGVSDAYQSGLSDGALSGTSFAGELTVNSTGGFTVGDNGGDADPNTNGETYQIYGQ